MSVVTLRQPTRPVTAPGDRVRGSLVMVPALPGREDAVAEVLRADSPGGVLGVVQGDRMVILVCASPDQARRAEGVLWGLDMGWASSSRWTARVS